MPITDFTNLLFGIKTFSIEVLCTYSFFFNIFNFQLVLSLIYYPRVFFFSSDLSYFDVLFFLFSIDLKKMALLADVLVYGGHQHKPKLKHLRKN